MKKVSYYVLFVFLIFMVIQSLTPSVQAEKYDAEYATLTGSCWTVDVWNVPMSGNKDNKPDYSGNMKFFACNDTVAPLYQSSFIIGWIDDGVKKVYSNAITADSAQYHLLARGPITVDSVGQPYQGNGYMFATGSWCTPDSVVFGTVKYIVPADKDTAVLIEQITFWIENGERIENTIIGEDIDWNCNRENAFDLADMIIEYSSLYLFGATALDQSVTSGMVTTNDQYCSRGATAINSFDYTAAQDGYYPEELYDLVASIDFTLNVFADSADGTDLRTVTRLLKRNLNWYDTIYTCTVKSISLTGYDDLFASFGRGLIFTDNHDLCGPSIPGCGGRCGDANNDSRVNVSDAVYIINYIFNGGNPPAAGLACGDASGDGRVNVSDAVYDINFVFSGGNPPGDCTPGSLEWRCGRCCAY